MHDNAFDTFEFSIDRTTEHLGDYNLELSTTMNSKDESGKQRKIESNLDEFVKDLKSILKATLDIHRAWLIKRQLANLVLKAVWKRGLRPSRTMAASNSPT